MQPNSRLPLRVDFGDACPAAPFPVRGGIPFPQGALLSADHVRLLIDGAESPCQVTQTAVWPDGSVKWLLLDFSVMPEQTVSLEYGPAVMRRPVEGGVEITQSDNAVAIDTGCLYIRVDRDGSGFVDELRVDGRVMTETGDETDRRHILDFVHVDETSDRPTNSATIAGTTDPSRVEIDTLTVEESGPLHAVILIRGRYLYQSVGSTIPALEERGACAFSLRLHLWAGRTMLMAEHFFVYDGDPDADFVRQVGLRLPLASVAEATTAAFETDHGLETCSLGNNACGLHQASADHFELWHTDQSNRPLVFKTGHQSRGWCHICGPSGGVAFGIRQLPEQYHKALHVDTDTGRIDAWLWPPEAPTLDHRRYAREWGVGEDGAYESGPMPVNYHLAAKGTGKSHELLFIFHTESTDPAAFREPFAAFEARPLVLAEPAWYADTQALGHYAAADEAAFGDLEAVIRNPIEYLMTAQAQSRWYGFFDYGDVQTCYATFHHHDRWESDFGRWGWANGDQVGRLNYALMLQFLRTGDRRLFAFAEANMRHVHDVDATHTTAYPFKMGDTFRNLAGSVHRHNAQHWACPYVGSRGAHPVGAKIHYYVTGSGRSLDILDEVLALSERIPEGAARDGHGAGALSFLGAWERTGDVAWRDKTLNILNTYGLEEIRGGWLAMISAAFGVFDAMVEYTDLSGDDRFRPLIENFAAMCMGPDIEENWTYPGGYFRIYAEALRMTGSGELIDGIGRARKRLNEQMQEAASFLPRAQWPAPKGEAGGAFSNFSIDANTLRDLPFIMYALKTNEEMR